MEVRTHVIEIPTRSNTHIVDATPHMRRFLGNHGFEEGSTVRDGSA